MINRREMSLAVGMMVAAALTGTALIAHTANASPVVGAPAPGFSADAAVTLTDANGVAHDLSTFADRTVVLEWTNHECPYVVKHYASNNMQGLQTEATADGVTWLQIISSAPGKQGHVSAEKALELNTERNAAPTAVILDASGDFGRLYDARTTPHMFVIEDGVLVFKGGIDNITSTKVEDIPRATNFVRAALASLDAGEPIVANDTAPYGCSIKY